MAAPARIVLPAPRAHLRLAYAPGENKTERANKALTALAGALASNADDAAFTYPGGASARNPLYTFVDLRGTFAAAEYLVELLKSRQDPRIGIFFTPAPLDSIRGTVRYPATSNYASWQIAQMLWISENHGYTAPTVSQPMYNLLARGIEQEYLACCKEFGISVIPYNPLAGGLLTGKHKPQEPPTAGTRFDGNKMYQERYWHADYFAAVEHVADIARRAGTLAPTSATRTSATCWAGRCTRSDIS